MVSVTFAIALLSFFMSAIALFVVLWTTLRKLDDRPVAKNDLSSINSSYIGARDLNPAQVPFFNDSGMPNVFDPEEMEY